ncbi:hypothetical protein AAGG49_23105, partial [Stenotrophomonas maltophilia]|uniref:hypothetical protein n=1 Tax=Stenotrophomonas maltophilia TaxID=40324 RepID=UPI00313D062B
HALLRAGGLGHAGIHIGGVRAIAIALVGILVATPVLACYMFNHLGFAMVQPLVAGRGPNLIAGVFGVLLEGVASLVFFVFFFCFAVV